jgi:hypothetical protein
MPERQPPESGKAAGAAAKPASTGTGAGQTPDRGPISVKASALARPFLPSVDLIEPTPAQIEAITDDEKRQVLEAKIGDVTHFRVGLEALHRHVTVAIDLAVDLRALPRQVIGLALNPDRSPAERVSVQPALPNGGATLGRGVLTDDEGLFTLPLPIGDIADDRRRLIVEGGARAADHRRPRRGPARHRGPAADRRAGARRDHPRRAARSAAAERRRRAH